MEGDFLIDARDRAARSGPISAEWEIATLSFRPEQIIAKQWSAEWRDLVSPISGQP